MIGVQETGAVAEPSDYRTRILDAAEACLMEQRMSAPLHARIAERAGVSRPTVYKYIGDQDDLVRAVLERVAAQYALAILPELDRMLTSGLITLERVRVVMYRAGMSRDGTAR